MKFPPSLIQKTNRDGILDTETLRNNSRDIIQTKNNSKRRRRNCRRWYRIWYRSWYRSRYIFCYATAIETGIRDGTVVDRSGIFAATRSGIGAGILAASTCQSKDHIHVHRSILVVSNVISSKTDQSIP